MRLWEIGNELMALSSLLDESDGELPKEFEDTLDGWFAGIGDDQADKLADYAAVIRKMQTEAAVAHAEAEQFLMKERFRLNTAERLKARIKEYMEGTNQQKCPTSDGRLFRIQANGGKLPLLIADPKLIPDEYKYTPEPVADNEKIRQAIESGEVLPFASIGERGTHLRIA
jgi:hypothetical protein